MGATGYGKLFDGETLIDEVEYDIYVDQNRIDVSAHDGEGTVPGMQNLFGTIKCLNKPYIPQRKPLLLETEEGININVVITDFSFENSLLRFTGKPVNV